MWSGTISFGLVNVPVKLYPAVMDRGIHFHMMSKDGSCRLRHKLVCPETGKEYDYKDTAKGYEIAPDQYVIVDPKELEDLKPEASRAIDIKSFTDVAEIDPLYYDRPYYLLPDEHGVKGYRLLVEAMARAKKVAIASFVMRGKEYLAAIRPASGTMCLQTMHYANEIVPPNSMKPPADVAVSAKELDVASRLVAALETDFDLAEYRDTYRERVAEYLERKAAGKKIVIAEPVDHRATRVTDLMKALEASINQARRGHNGERRRAGRAEEPRRTGVQSAKRRPKTKARSSGRKR
jgi:DNA end-binding protein Ku